MPPLLLVPVRYISSFLDILEGFGGDVGLALAAARINPAMLAVEEGFITPAQLDRLLLEGRRQTGRGDLGFELGWRIPTTAHELLGLAAISAKTVEASIRLVSRYYPLVSGLYAMEYARLADRGIVTFTARLPLHSDTKQMHIDVLIASFHAQLTRQTRSRVAAYDISIGLAGPQYRWRYADVRPARVTFDPDVEYLARIEISPGVLDRPLPMANAQTCRVAERICQAQLAEILGRTRLTDWVASAIRSIEDRMPTLEMIATACNFSPRTLDRRLALEGTSFRKVAIQVRHDMATQMLSQTEHPISEIAYRLGYRDAANFARAFRKVAGCSPSLFRSQELRA